MWPNALSILLSCQMAAAMKFCDDCEGPVHSKQLLQRHSAGISDRSHRSASPVFHFEAEKMWGLDKNSSWRLIQTNNSCILTFPTSPKNNTPAFSHFSLDRCLRPWQPLEFWHISFPWFNPLIFESFIIWTLNKVVSWNHVTEDRWRLDLSLPATFGRSHPGTNPAFVQLPQNLASSFPSGKWLVVSRFGWARCPGMEDFLHKPEFEYMRSMVFRVNLEVFLGLGNLRNTDLVWSSSHGIATSISWQWVFVAFLLCSLFVRKLMVLWFLRSSGWWQFQRCSEHKSGNAWRHMGRCYFRCEALGFRWWDHCNLMPSSVEIKRCFKWCRGKTSPVSSRSSLARHFYCTWIFEHGSPTMVDFGRFGLGHLVYLEPSGTLWFCMLRWLLCRTISVRSSTL